MRYGWCASIAMAFGLVTFGAQADGINGSGTATRMLPADILTVSFQFAGAARDAAAAEASPEVVLKKVLESKGFKVQEASARYDYAMAFDTIRTYPSTILPPGGSVPGGQIQGQASIRLTGFKRIADVVDVLEQNGVRENIFLSFSSSKSKDVFGDMQREAVDGALEDARLSARVAGVKTGNITAVAISSPDSASALYGTKPNLVAPAKEGELPQITFTVTANVILAIKPDA
jgi:uncharacterized protein YggE